MRVVPLSVVHNPRPLTPVLVALATLTLWGGVAPSASAGVVEYTFEAPLFTANETTPLLDRAPNVGSASFQTTFTSILGANSFAILTGVPNLLFSGQYLIDPLGGPIDGLVMTFNTPVTSLRVDFATNGPGSLELVTPSGSTTVTSGIVGGNFPGGTLTFSSLTPFTTAQFQARNTAGNPIEFALDNLRMETVDPSVVPEPSTFILCGVGLVVLGSARLRRRVRGA